MEDDQWSHQLWGIVPKRQEPGWEDVGNDSWAGNLPFFLVAAGPVLGRDVSAMGLMRFICPPDRITEETLQQAYLSGYDRIPWKHEVREADGELHLQRTVSDSGTLHILWHVESHGLLTLSTTTLMERPEAYYLPLELARGKIAQVRNQLAEWELLGLAVPGEVQEKLADAVGYFAQAAVVQHGSTQSVDSAEQAIGMALDAANLLAASYAQQIMALRRQSSQGVSALFGASLDSSVLDEYTADQFLQTFNAANVPLSWRDIESSQGNYSWSTADEQVRWGRANNLRVCAGPLFQFDQQYIPDWLTLYEGDFESLFSFGSEFVQAAVHRYRGQIDVWQCAGRMNTSNVLSLSEEERVKLVVRCIEIVHALDPDTSIVVSFDQPWGEYLSRREMDFPPLHFADALVRAGLGLSGLVLEINVGYWPCGTLPRDPLEFSRLLDYWSLLGVPVFLALTIPSGCHDDLLARRRAKFSPDDWTPKGQEAWVARYVPLLLAKPCVQGILWNQLRDGQAHDFAHGGLFDPTGQPKPALRRLAAIRETYLD